MNQTLSGSIKEEKKTLPFNVQKFQIFCKSFSVCVLNSKQKSQSLCRDNHKKKTNQ